MNRIDNTTPINVFSGDNIGPRPSGAKDVPPVFGLTLLIGAFLSVGVYEFHEYNVRTAIQQHGRRQVVDVVDIHQRVVKHPKSGDTCDDIVDYRFKPAGWSRPLAGSLSLGACNYSAWTIGYIEQNHTLPIAFDVTKPSVVRLNFGDRIFLEDTARTLKVNMLILTCFGALGVFAITALGLFRRT